MVDFKKVLHVLEEKSVYSYGWKLSMYLLVWHDNHVIKILLLYFVQMATWWISYRHQTLRLDIATAGLVSTTSVNPGSRSKDVVGPLAVFGLMVLLSFATDPSFAPLQMNCLGSIMGMSSTGFEHFWIDQAALERIAR